MGCGSTKKVLTTQERSKVQDRSNASGLDGHENLVYMKRKLLKISCHEGVKAIPYTLPGPKAVSSRYIPF